MSDSFAGKLRNFLELFLKIAVDRFSLGLPTDKIGTVTFVYTVKKQIYLLLKQQKVSFSRAGEYLSMVFLIALDK